MFVKAVFVCCSLLPLGALPVLAQSFDCQTVTEISTAECEALVALYTNTDGSNWVNNDGWLTTTTPCSWYGVNCTDGTVTELYLPGPNRLSGTIPPELGDLTHLRNLDLRTNQLSGPIPPELGHLNSLRYLYLGNNQLSDTIPPELGTLYNLEDLYLGGNRLSGTMPPELGTLTKLGGLDLSYNQLSGTIPPELGNLRSLWYLYLGGNRLSGTMPPELGNLAKLEDFYLGGNQLSGTIPPELGNLGNLEGFDLSYNQLSGTLPPELGNLNSLRYLFLSSNQLSGTIPPELGNLHSLTLLYLDDNQFSGTIPSELGNLNILRELNLYGNQFSGPLPLSFAQVAAACLVCDVRENDPSLCVPNTPDYQILGRNPLCGLSLSDSCTPTSTNVASESTTLPETYVLEPPFPNPFNPQTQIRFGIRQATPVQVELFDILGRRVRVLYRGVPTLNQLHAVTINGSGLPGGTYFVRMQGEGFLATQMVTLLK